MLKGNKHPSIVGNSRPPGVSLVVYYLENDGLSNCKITIIIILGSDRVDYSRLVEKVLKTVLYPDLR
jgi:hypothetical protein